MLTAAQLTTASFSFLSADERRGGPRRSTLDEVQDHIVRSVFEEQQKAFSALPAGAKMSITYDCWTSPCSQSFLVITGNFVDEDWALREVLLYFKRLDGTESPSWMANALMQTLTGHGIQDRVFALTIDTASPYKEMPLLLQSLRLQQAPLPSDIEIIQTPYLTSVVKLCLHRILEHLGALPLNDMEDEIFIKKKLALDQAIGRGHVYEISHTLNKLRYLHFHMNYFEEGQEAFKDLQDDRNGEKLLLISDAQKRRLRNLIAPFCAHYGYEELLLDDEEWLQVDQLLCIMEPFVQVISDLTFEKQSSIQSVLNYYQILFQDLEYSMKQLREERVPWKRQIFDSLEVCREELAGYHEQTTQNSIYAVSTMLAPDLKFQFFRSDDWEKEKLDIYRSSFEQALLRCQEKPETPIKEALLSSEANDELCQWLDSESHDGWCFNDSLEFWTAEHSTYPCVAKLARNILPVPASGGVVERLFNTARQASCGLNLPEELLILKPKLIYKPKPCPITEEFETQFLSTFTTSFEFSPDQSTQYRIFVALPEEKEILAEERDFV
ncbi:hypothetical protein N7528_005491 [Penicillium herquei]|nr:hypothetical protein N7528_005491 [Penicillium herquei]